MFEGQTIGRYGLAVVGYHFALVRRCSIFLELGLIPSMYYFFRFVPITVVGTGLAYLGPTLSKKFKDVSQKLKIATTNIVLQVWN